MITKSELLIKYPHLINKNLGYYVYIYINPLNGNIFYVGKGKNTRFIDHLQATINNHKTSIKNKHKYYTIKKILRNNLFPIIKIIKNKMTNNEACDFEIKLIKKLKNKKLSNIAKGGTGGDTLSNHPNKIKIYKKISASNKGKIHTKDYKDKMSKLHSGKGNPFYNKTHTDINKYKSGSVYRNKPQSIEHINKRKRYTHYTIINIDTNELLYFKSLIELKNYFKNKCKHLPKKKKISGQILNKIGKSKNFKLISKNKNQI